MRAAAAAVAVALLAAAAASAQRPPTRAFEPRQEDVSAFPDFPGRDEAFAYCAACHAFRLVANQRMSRPQWEAALAWMSEKHAMPPLEPADRDVILGYLAKAFAPAEAPGGRAGWRNPFQPN